MTSRLNRRHFLSLSAGFAAASLASPLSAQIYYRQIPTQYIAALAEPGATSGNNAETWGHWASDPGPVGVPLPFYQSLQEAGGRGPGGWTFDINDWWLDENGILMEAPRFPMPVGEFFVTNGEDTYSLLTVSAPDAEGHQAWSLSRLTIADVTHGPCRAGRYRPLGDSGSCTPENADQTAFPLPLGDKPIPVEGCDMKEYAVLIIFGVPVDPPEES